MQDRWQRTALVELVGVFGLVLFSAGVVCVNHLTTSDPAQAGTAPLTLHQPGLFGVALAQGLILAVLLGLTVPVSGGYLNPAVTLTLWAFGRMESARAGILVAAQTLGSVLAAGCLRFLFTTEILQAARFGAPHVNSLTFPILGNGSIVAGTGVELLLTFFLVLAMFRTLGSVGDAPWAALGAGMVQTAAVLFAFPLTGAALNPARWVGPVLWEAVSRSETATSPWADFLVYLAGPTIGALLAGLFRAWAMPAAPPPRTPAPPGKKS